MAPAGSPVTDRVMVPPLFIDPLVTVKLIHVPAVTVWFPGTVSVGGTSACTLIVIVAGMLVCGDAESVAVRLTVYCPGAEYAWVVVLPLPLAPSPKSSAKVYGRVPPVADDVKVTVWPTWGEYEEACSDAERGGVVTTVTD